MEDAKEILQGKAYHWREWSICRGRDCLYVWSDSAALELSNGSNGWFRFILDGKLATMYSSGSPENGNDSSGKQHNYYRTIKSVYWLEVVGLFGGFLFETTYFSSVSLIILSCVNNS